MVVVVFMFAIVLLLALVVNVGFWLQAQRRAQNVADAVALAVASQIPSGACPGAGTQAVADCYADKNWPQFTDDGTVTVDPPAGTSVTVHVRHPVPGFFTSLIGEAFGTVTVGAHATATAQAPATLDNQNLHAITQTPTYVAPIVVTDDACGQAPPWTTCLGSSQTLTLNENNPGASSINIVDLSCAVQTGGCQNPGATTLASWITCGPCLTGVVGVGGQLPVMPVNVLDACPRLNGMGPRQCTIRNALQSVRGNTIIAAVSDGEAGGEYHVVGYAALAITRVPSMGQWRNPAMRTTKSIDVLFLPYTPEPTLDASGVAPAYGIQTIGLTG